jgi:protein-arginine deiminase
MRTLLQVESLNGRRSRSKERIREYEDVLVVGQPLQVSLQNLAPANTKFVNLETQGEVR